MNEKKIVVPEGMSEVKRRTWSQDENQYVPAKRGEVILYADHEREMAQKDAEIAALKGATKYDELMRDPVFKKAYAKEFAADDRERMETEIAELKAHYEELKSQNDQVCATNIKLHAEIARLSSLLDRLNEKLERYERDWQPALDAAERKGRLEAYRVAWMGAWGEHRKALSQIIEAIEAGGKEEHNG